MGPWSSEMENNGTKMTIIIMIITIIIKIGMNFLKKALSGSGRRKGGKGGKKSEIK